MPVLVLIDASSMVGTAEKLTINFRLTEVYDTILTLTGML